MPVSQNGTQGRVYGGDANLVHIADGTRKDVGKAVAEYLEDEMLTRAFAAGQHTGTLCPGCYMIALFNAAIHLAEANGQSITELGNTMSKAFAKLAEKPASGLTEEIEVILDDDCNLNIGA